MFLHLQGKSRKFQRGRGATQVCIYPSKKGTSGGGGVEDQTMTFLV